MVSDETQMPTALSWAGLGLHLKFFSISKKQSTNGLIFIKLVFKLLQQN